MTEHLVTLPKTVIIDKTIIPNGYHKTRYHSLGQNLQIMLSMKVEKEHIICGYNTLINWDKTGDEKVTALIEVKVTPQRGLGFDSIAETIYKYDEVTSVYLMSGGFDFTVIIEGKTMKSVAQFVAAKVAPPDSVLSTSTHFVLKKFKDF